MNIDTTFLRDCIAKLERGFHTVKHTDIRDETRLQLCKAACVKEFEVVLEQSGKLLRKRLAAFFASNRTADSLDFKDLFRHATRHGLIDAETCERWLIYRDNPDGTADLYDEKFAESTIALLPTFIQDAKFLVDVIEQVNHV